MEQQVIEAIDRYLAEKQLTVKQFLLNQGNEARCHYVRCYYWCLNPPLIAEY